MSNKNKRITRLIFYVLLLNISSILFGAARIDRVENSLISDLSIKSTNEDISYESLWFDAAKLNNIETLELLLLSNKININKSDSDGNTALHIAVIEGYKDLLVLLLKNGADLTVKNNNKYKAVDLAKKSGNYEIVRILYDKPINNEIDNAKNGINVYEKEEKKKNSLINRNKCEICNKSFSLKSGLVRHKRTHSDEKPFNCDSKGCNYNTVYKHHLVRHKRSHTGEKPYKCDICNKGFSENSILVRHKRTHVKCDRDGCDYIISGKKNLILHNRKHLTEELFKMISNNQKDQVEELVSRGADINGKDLESSTALHLTVIMSRKEILEILIKAGANINLLDRNGKTAEKLAFDLGNSEFVSIFQRAAKEFDARQLADKK